MDEAKAKTTLMVADRSLEALSLSRSPDVVMEEATRAAKALRGLIENKKKKVVFNGETYLEFEDWQTLGRSYGVTSRVRETHHVTLGDDPEHEVQGFEAKWLAAQGSHDTRRAPIDDLEITERDVESVGGQTTGNGTSGKQSAADC